MNIKNINSESKLDRRSRYSIQAIRQALFQLLDTKKLDEITVVDVCNTADINRGTFYKYYRDVPDLYDKTENSLVEELYSLVEKKDSYDFHDDFIFNEILTILAGNKEFTYIAQNKIFSERLAQKLLVLFTPYLEQMLHAKCPGATDQDADILLEYILGGCIRVVSYWLNDGMKLPIEEIDNKLSAMISHSLSIYM